MVASGALAVRGEHVHQLRSPGDAEPGGHPYVVQEAGIIEQAQEEGSDAPVLVLRKPPTTQSAVRSCLTFIITRLPG